VADEAIIYRCINDACGRPAPRPVNFCPWCGTAQGRAGVRGRDAGAQATAVSAAPAASDAAAAAAAGASAAAALSGWSDAPMQPEAPGAAAPPTAAQPTTAQPTTAPHADGPGADRPRADTAAPSAARQGPAPAAAPSATEFGRSGKGSAAPGAAAPGAAPAGPAVAPPHQEVPRPPLAAHPPQRKPIRLRWWILALAVLWAVWLVAKPSAKKIDRRIDAAIAMAHQCRGSEAQAELIALRKSSATPEQLQRLQQGLNDEAAICTRRRQRAKAWDETSAAAESALAADGWEKARTRLLAFIRRWGEDDNTRALKNRIEDARREDEARRTHPLAAPSE
jgi:hypothetical protein